MLDLIGKTIGKYKIVSQLGRGGMAEVYKAYQANLDRSVAIKVILSHLAEDPEYLRRFEREAKNVAALRHPNIVQVFDYDIHGELSYMVMEFIEGVTLKTYLEELALRGESLPLVEALRIVKEIGGALVYAHGLNMIHRDVKPANVMITPQGRVILTDFGLAKIIGGQTMTLTGAAIGTPAYMAPEQGLGDTGDPRADLYSLGIILYELVSGRRPFDADTPLAIMLKHMSEPVPDITTIKTDLPAELHAVVLKSLAKKPEERYASVEEMLNKLDKVVSQLETQPGREVFAGETLPVEAAEAQKPAPLPPHLEPPEPAVLPLPIDFIGRAAELETYAAQLAAGHLVVLTGMAGSGKTSLGAALAVNTTAPSMVFWHSFHAGEGINALIWTLAGFLYWRGRPNLWAMLSGAQASSSQLPPPEVLFDYLFPLLRGQGFLLCLDNFDLVEEDPLQAQFLERLEGAAAKGELSAIIVAAQKLSGLSRAEEFEPVGGFSLPDAHQFLASREVNLPADLEKKLYNLTAGNAQLLTLAADVVKQGKEPARLLANLAEAESIERYLVKTIDEQLEPEERKVTGALSVMSGFPASREAVAAALDGESVRLQLNALGRRYLIVTRDGSEGREFALRPLVEAFYYDLLGRQERQRMHLRVGEFYISEEPRPLRSALHLQRAGEVERALGFATQDVRRMLNQGEALLLRLVLAGFNSQSLQPALAARLELAKGQVRDFMGEPLLARACFQTALEAIEKVLDTSEGRLLKSKTCLSLGELLQHDHPYEALEWLEKGLRALPESKTEELEKETAAALLIRRGRIHVYLGELATAQKELEEGLSSLPPGPTRLRISALGNLGTLHCIRGETYPGQLYYHQAMDVARQMDDFWSMNEARHNLAYELDISGKWDEAEAMYRQELDEAERFGSNEQRLRSRLHLGILAAKRGDAAVAFASLSECAEMSRQSNPHYLVYTLPSLAEIYLGWSQPQKAEALLVEAEALARETGSGQAEAMPEIYRTWSLARLAQKDISAALVYANRALELARELESGLEEGIGQRVAGLVLCANGQLVEGLASFEQGVKLLQRRNPYEAARTRRAWGECLVASGSLEGGNALLKESEVALRNLGVK